MTIVLGQQSSILSIVSNFSTFKFQVIFLFDMILTFNSAYYSEYGELISSRQAITINYLKSWFFIDLISIFPFETLPNAQTDENTHFDNVDDYFRLTRFPRLYRLFKLARIVKMVKKIDQNKYAESLGVFLKLNVGILRIVVFLFTFIIGVHISGCLWYYTAKVNEFEPSTWVYEEGYIGKDEFTLYIVSIYWSVQTIATVGFGDITPHNDLERITCLIWQIFGVGIYTFTVGSLCELIGVLDTKFQFFYPINRQGHLENKITMMDEFCDEANLSKEIRMKIRRSLSYASQKNVFTKSQRDHFLQEIPLQLRYQVSQCMFDGIPKELRFFKNKEPIFQACFVPALQPLKIGPGEIIYQKGEHPNLVYFLVKGRVNMVIGLHQITFKTYVQGSYFGEVEVLDLSQRLHTARTEVECELLTITSEEFQNILKVFPEYEEEVKRVALQKLKGENEAIQKMQAIANLGFKSDFWRKSRKKSLYEIVKQRQELLLPEEASFSEEEPQQEKVKRRLAERSSIAMIPLEYHRSIIPKKKEGNVLSSEKLKVPNYARHLNHNKTMIEVRVIQHFSQPENEQKELVEDSDETDLHNQLNKPEYLTFSERWLCVPKSRVSLLTLQEEKIDKDLVFQRQIPNQESLEQQLQEIIQIVSEINLKRNQNELYQKIDKETQTSVQTQSQTVQTDLKMIEWNDLLEELEDFEIFKK